MNLHHQILLYCTIVLLMMSCTKKAALQTTTPTKIEESSATIATDTPFQIFLVRHAEKSTNDPRDPDLSEKGQERAEKLMYHLAQANITKIYATQYKRTQQTVMPLAKKLGIEIEIYETDLSDMTKLMQEATQGNILIAGHSNTTPKLANKLLGTQTYEKLDETVFDKLFLITKSSDHFTSTLLQY